MQEEWRPVQGFEGYYEVSNTGRARSCDRETPNSLTGGVSLVPGRVLVGRLNRGGYRQFTLSVAQKNTTRKLHRMVAQAFLPNPDDLPLVLHGPAGKGDNSVLNLRWGTNSDNMRDRRRDGTDHELNKTHCPRGHPYSDDNTRREGSSRRCRTCLRERERVRWRPQ